MKGKKKKKFMIFQCNMILNGLNVYRIIPQFMEC